MAGRYDGDRGSYLEGSRSIRGGQNVGIGSTACRVEEGKARARRHLANAKERLRGVWCRKYQDSKASMVFRPGVWRNRHSPLHEANLLVEWKTEALHNAVGDCPGTGSGHIY